jgi:PII-like signaling protein
MKSALQFGYFECQKHAFGCWTRLHNSHILRLSLDLPVVVEIADETENIKAFLPELEKMMGSGLVTIERVRVFRYRH